jgi:hypothetical protein
MEEVNAIGGSEDFDTGAEDVTRLHCLAIMTVRAVRRLFDWTQTPAAFHEFFTAEMVSILWESRLECLVAKQLLSQRSVAATTFLRLCSTHWSGRFISYPIAKYLRFVPFSAFSVPGHISNPGTLEWLQNLAKFQESDADNMEELRITLAYIREYFTLDGRLPEALSVAKRILDLPASSHSLEDTECEGTHYSFPLKYFTRIYEFFAYIHLLIAGNESESEIGGYIRDNFVSALKHTIAPKSDVHLVARSIYEFFLLLTPKFDRRNRFQPPLSVLLCKEVPIFQQMQLSFRIPDVYLKCQQWLLTAVESEWMGLVDVTVASSPEPQFNSSIKALFTARSYLKVALFCLSPEPPIPHMRWNLFYREAEEFSRLYPSSDALIDFARSAAAQFPWSCLNEYTRRLDAQLELICVPSFSWVDWNLWSSCSSLSTNVALVVIKWLEKYLDCSPASHSSSAWPIEAIDPTFLPEYKDPALLEVLVLLHLGLSAQSERAALLERRRRDFRLPYVPWHTFARSPLCNKHSAHDFQPALSMLGEEHSPKSPIDVSPASGPDR